MPSLHEAVVVLVAVAHLGAAGLPCPSGAADVPAVPGATASHAVDHHAHGAHGMPAPRAASRPSAPDPGSPAPELAARCTCGCGGAPSGDGVAGRLGHALLRDAPARVARPFARRGAPTPALLPESPPADLDPVPI